MAKKVKKEKVSPKEAMALLMKDLNSTIKGANPLKFGSDVEEKIKYSTGVEAIDEMLGGGITAGQWTVFYGAPGGGKTTLANHTIVEAQKHGIVIYIDAERKLNIPRIRILGVNTDDIMIIDEFKTAEECFDLLRKLLDSGLVSLVVVDSINALVVLQEVEENKKDRSLAKANVATVARLMSTFTKVINNSMYKNNTAVICIGQVRQNIGIFGGQVLSGGNAIKHAATAILKLTPFKGKADQVTRDYSVINPETGRPNKKSDVVGFNSLIKVEKNHGGGVQEGFEKKLPFWFEGGFIEPEWTTEPGQQEKDEENEECSTEK